MPTPGTKKMEATKASLAPPRSGRSSVSNENNVLLDPEVLTDYPTQALVLTVLVSARCLLSYLGFGWGRKDSGTGVALCGMNGVLLN